MYYFYSLISYYRILYDIIYVLYEMNPADTAAKRSNEFFCAICPFYAHTRTHTYIGYIIITTRLTVYSHTVRRKLNLLYI